MRNTELFRRNVIIVLFYLLAQGFLLFKTKKGGEGAAGEEQRRKSSCLQMNTFDNCVQLFSVLNIWTSKTKSMLN